MQRSVDTLQANMDEDFVAAEVESQMKSMRTELIASLEQLPWPRQMPPQKKHEFMAAIGGIAAEFLYIKTSVKRMTSKELATQTEPVATLGGTPVNILGVEVKKPQRKSSNWRKQWYWEPCWLLWWPPWCF